MARGDGFADKLFFAKSNRSRRRRNVRRLEAARIKELGFVNDAVAREQRRITGSQRAAFGATGIDVSTPTAKGSAGLVEFGSILESIRQRDFNRERTLNEITEVRRQARQERDADKKDLAFSAVALTVRSILSGIAASKGGSFAEGVGGLGVGTGGGDFKEGLKFGFGRFLQGSI